MSEFLANSIRELLQLDEESIGQIVHNAEALEGSDLKAFLEGFLGPGAIVDDYLKLRYPSQQESSKPTKPVKISNESQAIDPQGPQAISGPKRDFISNGVWDGPETKRKSKSDSAKSQGSKSKTQIKVDSLHDIDSALRQLEISENKRSKCNCRATRHPLLEIAPNCLNCGKIICVKEGLGRCTYCGNHLISAEQLSSINQILRSEKDEISSSMGKKARQRAGAGFVSDKLQSAHSEAEARLNTLLEFQDSSAQRTKIIDQVSDFQTSVNKWASPMEQAQQLKRQQREMRKTEQARLSRQGRGKKVISIDIKGNKVYANEEDAALDDSSDSEREDDLGAEEKGSSSSAHHGSSTSSKKPVNWNPSEYGKDFIRPTATTTGGKKKAENVPSIEARGTVAFDESRALEM